VGSAIDGHPIYDLVVGESIEDEIDVTAGIANRGHPNNPVGDIPTMAAVTSTGLG
jgi:hypothetical protein